MLFKKQKVDSTGYYGIEDPFPDLISKLRRFRGGYVVRIVFILLCFALFRLSLFYTGVSGYPVMKQVLGS